MYLRGKLRFRFLRKTQTSCNKDENVFDIQQGVSIVLLVKNKNLKKFIKYVDLWGLREEKYKFLEKSDVYKTSWIELDPKFPNNYFIPKNTENEEDYNKFISLKNIFKNYNAGIATGKDEFLTDFNRKDLLNRLSFKDETVFKLLMQELQVDKDISDKWFLELQKIDIDSEIRPFDYRPFDTRWIIYNDKLLQRARDVIMKHLLKPNLALLSMRQYAYSLPYSHAFVTQNVVNRRIFISNRGAAHVFPLYLYDNIEQQSLLDKQGRSINLRWENLGWLETLQPFASTLTGNFIQVEEAIFYYIYAVLCSNIYREKYQEFLKIDFPRVPFTKDYALFKALVQRGEQLVKLHLLKSEEMGNPIIKFQGKGENVVEKVEFNNGFVFINKDQYFFEMPDAVRNYYIGGYQVVHKWLKDRKGRVLSSEDIKHYCRVVTALSKTIEVQEEIDRLYPKVEESL